MSDLPDNVRPFSPQPKRGKPIARSRVPIQSHTPIKRTAIKKKRKPGINAKRRTTPPSRSELCKLADDLWGKIIRSPGQCARCGTTTNLQAAHIIRKTYYPVRQDLRNGICMCRGCHLFWAHLHELEFDEWIIDQIGLSTWLLLRKLALSKERVDYAAILPGLQAKANALR